MSDQENAHREALVDEAWPYIFAGLSLSHAAALGAFLSKIDFQANSNGLLGALLFVGFLTLGILIQSYFVTVLRYGSGGRHVIPIYALTFVPCVWGLLIASVENENQHYVQLVICVVFSWFVFSYLLAKICRYVAVGRGK